MRCGTCGNEIADGSMFCEICGAAQNTQPVQPAQSYGNPMQNTQPVQQTQTVRPMQPYGNPMQNAPQVQPTQPAQNMNTYGQPMPPYGQQMPNMNSPYGQPGGYAQPSYPGAKKSSAGFIVFVVIMLMLIAAEVVLFLAPGFLTKSNREKKIKEQLGITSSVTVEEEEKV